MNFIYYHIFLIVIFLVATIPISLKANNYVIKNYKHKLEKIYKLAPDELSYNYFGAARSVRYDLFFSNKLLFDDYIKKSVWYVRIFMLLFALLYIAIYVFFK